jgi:hypothetical protein
VLHVEAELLDLIEPAGQEAVDVLLRAEPRDGLVVGPECKIRQHPRGARGAAAEEIVAEDPEGVGSI